MTVKRKIFQLISTIPAWEAFQCLRERWYWGEPYAIRMCLLSSAHVAISYSFAERRRYFEIETLLKSGYPNLWSDYARFFGFNDT